MKTITDIVKYDTATGIFVPDFDVLKSSIEEDFRKNIFRNQNVDLSLETHIGRLIDWFASVLFNAINISSSSANQLNINYATGYMLDNIGSLYALKRKAATNTTCYCKMTGIQNTVIPEGSLVRSTENHETFSLNNTVTLDANGEAIALFTAVNTGPISCEIGDVSEIETAVVGWNTVTNTTQGVIGTHEESDTIFRNRIIKSRSIGIPFTDSLFRDILSIDNVISCNVLNNGGVADDVFDGISIPAHSIFVCVLGGDAETVAKAIYKNKTAGCGIKCDNIPGATKEEVTIVDSNNGYEYPVTFYRPLINSQSSVTVSIYRGVYSGTNLCSDVKALVYDYFNNLKIGEDALSIQLALRLQDTFRQSVISDVKFNTNQVRINSNGYTVLRVSPENITVTFLDNNLI